MIEVRAADRRSVDSANRAIAANASRPSPGRPNVRPASGVASRIARTAQPFTTATADPGLRAQRRCVAEKMAEKGRPAPRPKTNDAVAESQSRAACGEAGGPGAAGDTDRRHARTWPSGRQAHRPAAA